MCPSNTLTRDIRCKNTNRYLTYHIFIDFYGLKFIKVMNFVLDLLVSFRETKLTLSQNDPTRSFSATYCVFIPWNSILFHFETWKQPKNRKYWRRSTNPTMMMAFKIGCMINGMILVPTRIKRKLKYMHSCKIKID